MLTASSEVILSGYPRISLRFHSFNIINDLTDFFLKRAKKRSWRGIFNDDPELPSRHEIRENVVYTTPQLLALFVSAETLGIMCSHVVE